MSESFDKFIKMLLRSGLITESQLKEFRKQLDNDLHLSSDESLVSKLAESGHLSDFQAKELLEGNIDNLIVGDYVLLQPVGKGGMGEVFRARHCVMKREVALKFTLPNEDGEVTEAFVKRFQREVETASQLLHPNIVSSLDAGQRGEVCYLVMEFITGVNLAQHVRKHGTLSFAKALDCIIQVAQGLEYAHRKGVVHRDIKPSNLILTDDGVVKIMDMGLVRHTATPDVSQATIDLDEQLTKTGHLLGTVDFMAPEQAVDPRSADARSDIYSLGCTLYYLLKGTAPYRLYPNATTMSRVIAHREEAIPKLSDTVADVPSSFQKVFEKMLNKVPSQRYRSASELLTDLRKVQAHLDSDQISLTDTRTYSYGLMHKAKTRAWLRLAVVLALVGIAIVAGLMLMRPAGKVENGEKQAESEVTASDSIITQTTDLLTNIDLNNSWMVGKEWKLENGTLFVPDSIPSKLLIPVKLPTTFQITVKVQRVGGAGPFALGVSNKDYRFHLLIDAARKGGAVRLTALGSIGGRLATSVENVLKLEPQTDTLLRLNVTPKSITLLADNEQVFVWDGKLQELSLPGGWQVGEAAGMFVGSNDSGSFRVTRLEVSPNLEETTTGSSTPDKPL